jgi:trehalose 6-phosphate synthase/phosphatase
VLHKLLSFEQFLEKFPQWRDKVVLIQVTTADKSQRINTFNSSKLSEIVSRINGTYGSLEFVPVHHYQQNLGSKYLTTDPDEFYALLCVADVALITPLRYSALIIVME